MDRHRGGHRTALANGLLRGGRDLVVLRVRQAVADERRFERDDRPAVGQGVLDLFGDLEQVVSIGG